MRACRECGDHLVTHAGDVSMCVYCSAWWHRDGDDDVYQIDAAYAAEIARGGNMTPVEISDALDAAAYIMETR